MHVEVHRNFQEVKSLQRKTQKNKLLVINNQFLKFCKDEREAVPLEHEKLFSNMSLSVDRLRRKFSTFPQERIPTVDPLMPDEVRRAK